MLEDPRKRCTLFCNEHFTQTFVERKKNETKEQRNDRALVKAVKWWESHLRESFSVPLIFISDEPNIRRLSDELGLTTLRSHEYMSQYFANNSSLLDLYDSLLQVAKETKENSSGGKGELFGPHLAEEIVEANVKSGNLFKGNIKVNGYNPDEAWVTLDLQLENHVKDIFIPGKKNRNRAVHGDTVAVELLPVKEWTAPSRVLRKVEEIEEENSENTKVSKSSMSTKENAKKVPTGKVVAIVKRNWRPYVCTIQWDREKNGESSTNLLQKESVLCVPMDLRIPKIRIKTRQVESLLPNRIVIRMDEWDSHSLYPSGHYVAQLGPIGKIDTETAALLVENNITVTPFAPNMLLGIPTIPPGGSWELPESDTSDRLDLRKHRIYSIDPKDIDDALSVSRLPNGNFQVGVHIADVTYFLPQGCPLDLEAQNRSTTVYLCDRKFDMLPTSISEHLASLRQHVDRPAVSVLWEFEPKDLRVVHTWFGRTVIRSSHELEYSLAQRICDDSCGEEERSQFSDYALLREELLTLTRIARKLRQDRAALGALDLESVEVRFELRGDEKTPVKILPKEALEIHKVVEEWMVTANSAVAQRIYKGYPQSALLRHHPLPREGRFDRLIALAASQGFPIDVRSNKTLSQSLSQAVLPSDPTFNRLLRSITTLAMEEAQYISAGSYSPSEYFHYGLAVSFYTHFTSPIRRYADVIVHRQLLGTLRDQPPPYTNEGVSHLAHHINIRHRAAKEAQRDSVELFQSLYFAKHSEVEEAVISDFLKNGFEIFIPRYGIRGNVFLRNREDPGKYKSQIVVSDFSVNEEHTVMTLHTDRGPLGVQMSDHVTVSIHVGTSRAHRPPLSFQLVHFGALGNQAKENPSNRNQMRKEITQTILEDEKKQNSLAFRVPENVLKDYSIYAQPKDKNNVFVMLDMLKGLSLDEEDGDEEPQKKEKDMVVRYWKLKKRPKAKRPLLEDEENFLSEEILTEAEMIEKRQEIEERRKSQMSVEEKYRSQIGQVQHEMKLRALSRRK